MGHSLVVRAFGNYSYLTLTGGTFECITVKNSKRLLQMFVATRYATQIRSSSNVCRYSICDLEKVEFKCFEVPFERSEPLFDW